MTTASVTVKFGACTHTVTCGTTASVKSSLVDLTGLSVGEMRLVSRGKVLGEASPVLPGIKLMLLRSAPKPTLTLTLRDIVSGRHAIVNVPLTCKHDDLAATALKALGLPSEAETGERLPVCVRLYLPHIASLMRIDLTLADYFAAAQAGSDAVVYLVPCAPGLRMDAAASAEMIAEATRAEVEATHIARVQIEDEIEAHIQAELLRHALIPSSIIDFEEEREESDPLASASSSSPSTSSASLVPARIRTGLLASMDDVQVVPVPVQALADLEAFEAYDAEMRFLSEMSPAAARELMVATEEARLEERCAMLVRTLDVPAEKLADPPARPGVRPGTPALGRPQFSQGISQQGISHGISHGVSQGWGTEELSEGCMSCEVVEGLDPSTSLGASLGASLSQLGGLERSASLGSSLSQLKKPKATRKMCCKACECRLPLTAATTSSCACGETFCAAHMHAHECQFDFRAREQLKLAKSNPKVEHSKLDRL